MSTDTTIKLKRGQQVNIKAYTGSLAEPMWDTTNKLLRIGDGIYSGGHPTSKSDMLDILEAKADVMRANCPSGFLPPHNTSNSGIGYVDDYTYSTTDLSTLVTLGIFDKLSLYLQKLENATTAHSNLIYFVTPLCFNAYGHILKLKSNTTKTSYIDFFDSAPPTTGTRQDLVVLEVWKEQFELGDANDVVFPYGNVMYDYYGSDGTGTYLGCTLQSSSLTLSGTNSPAYMATATKHGRCVLADDDEIDAFLNNPFNNVGVDSDGHFYQMRWRFAILENYDHRASVDSGFLKSRDGSYFTPQGKLASRYAAQTDPETAYGIHIRQGCGLTTEIGGYIDDYGLYLGLNYTISGAALAAIPTISTDGYTYTFPICAVNRRNTTAYNAVSNPNGGVSISVGTSDRPDGKYYDIFTADDILDLRHKVSPKGFDYATLVEETKEQLLKGDLVTNWEIGNFQYASDASDLISNGAFTSNTSGWTGTNCTLSSVSGGVSGNCLQVSSSSTATVYFTNTDAITTEIGHYYRLDFYAKAGTMQNETIYANSKGSTEPYDLSITEVTSSWRKYSTVFQATSVSTTIRIGSVSPSAGSLTIFFDSISLQEVEPIFSTKPLTSQTVAGIDATIVSQDWVTNRTNNDLLAGFDGYRNRYSDEVGLQAVFEKINDESAIDVTTSKTVTNGNCESADFSAWSIDSYPTLVGSEITITRDGGGGAGAGTTDYYLKLTDTTASKYTYETAYTEVTGLTIGKLYKLTTWVKSGSTGAETYNIYVTDPLINGSVLGSATGETTGSWVKVDVFFNAKSTTVNIGLSRVETTAGDMLFDEITVVEYPGDGFMGYDTGFVIKLSTGAFTCNDYESLNRPIFAGRRPSVTWGGASENTDYTSKAPQADVTWDVLSGDLISGTVNTSTYCKITLSPDPPGRTLLDGVTVNDGTVDVIIDGRSETGAVEYSGYFAGTTAPVAGTWSDSTGSFTVSSVDIGYKFEDYQEGKAHYVGEGSDLHAAVPAESLLITAYPQFGLGNGALNRVPYRTTNSELDEYDDWMDGCYSIKASRFYPIDGTQVVPNNGINYQPFGVDADLERILDDDDLATNSSHTRSSSVIGFISREGGVKPNTLGTHDSDQVQHPCIINDSGTYKVWYTGNDGSNERIMYATSTDGYTWSTPAMVIDIGDEGTYDISNSNNPYVIKEGASDYKMWYSGLAADGKTRIIYADSSDGITWANHGVTNLINLEGTYDALGSAGACVILDGSTYKIWYAGWDGSNSRICYATSADGITWTNQTLVLDTELISADIDEDIYPSCVILDGTIYKMWVLMYNGSDYKIAYTFSLDGKNWAKPEIVIDFKALRDADCTSLGKFSVIKDGRSFKGLLEIIDNDLEHGLLPIVLTMSTGHSSETSGYGKYTNEGGLNFAPTSSDKVEFVYEHRALQQDWSRFPEITSGSASYTGTLRYLDSNGVCTTIGTGGTPQNVSFPKYYRDFVGSLVNNGLGQGGRKLNIYEFVGDDSGYDSDNTLYNITGSDVRDYFKNNAITFKDDVLYKLTSNSNQLSSDRIRSGSYISVILGSNNTIHHMMPKTISRSGSNSSSVYGLDTHTIPLFPITDSPTTNYSFSLFEDGNNRELFINILSGFVMIEYRDDPRTILSDHKLFITPLGRPLEK